MPNADSISRLGLRVAGEARGEGAANGAEKSTLSLVCPDHNSLPQEQKVAVGKLFVLSEDLLPSVS